jgi:NitT/TauT family transport system ATP-binding protein
VKIVQDIDLPRPRDVFHVRFTPRFGELFEQLWGSLEEDIRKGVEV